MRVIGESCVGSCPLVSCSEFLITNVTKRRVVPSLKHITASSLHCTFPSNIHPSAWLTDAPQERSYRSVCAAVRLTRAEVFLTHGSLTLITVMDFNSSFNAHIITLLRINWLVSVYILLGNVIIPDLFHLSADNKTDILDLFSSISTLYGFYQYE